MDSFLDTSGIERGYVKLIILYGHGEYTLEEICHNSLLSEQEKSEAKGIFFQSTMLRQIRVNEEWDRWKDRDATEDLVNRFLRFYNRVKASKNENQMVSIFGRYLWEVTCGQS